MCNTQAQYRVSGGDTTVQLTLLEPDRDFQVVCRLRQRDE